MAVSLRIHFDRANAVFFAGETVTGHVVMNVSRPKKVRAVSIRFRGEANVMWTESRSKTNSDGSRSRDTDTYRNHETYFDNRVYFLGGDEGEVEVFPGQHVFNFQCLLPKVVPSSFEGEHGSVRYTATAAMHRPWKFDHTAKAAFTVITDLDLNVWPQAKEPVSMAETKSFCCGCCRSGPLSLDVNLSAGGYVPGQAILGQVRVDNASSVRVERVSCSLDKEVTWHARTKRKVTRRLVATARIGDAVDTHNTRDMPLAVVVPAVPPSNLHHCNIIDLKYILRVTAEVAGVRFNLHCNIPILLGTVPVFVQEGYGWGAPPAVGQQPSAPPPSAPPPSAPPPYPASLPPPTYEESVLKGNSIMDANDSYTMGQADFTPRYPVWAFNNNAGPGFGPAGHM